ncbi:MAG: ATP-grasp domain-containing protein [Actinobacteria bacterium]|nr:ATP-grasp domain-containing protein [Actinomycetota bacterium]
MSTAALVVLGAGLSQRPLIRRAKERGLTTCVVDGRTDRPAAADADLFVHQDFSDVPATIAALEAAEVEAVGICSMGSEQAVVPGARLAEALGLPGLPVSAALAATDKVVQRGLYRDHGVPSAGFAPARTLAEALAAYDTLGPRVIIKPTDGAAQRGVSDVQSRDDVAMAVEHAIRESRTGELIVEEHLSGREYTVNAFVLGGVFHPVTVTLRDLAPEPAVGICVAHRYPCGRSDEDIAMIIDVVRQAAMAIGIDAAPVYAQVRFDGTGPRMIECGARLGGGSDAQLAELVVGVDLMETVLDAALGLLDGENLTPRPMPEPFGHSRFVIPEAPGRIVQADEGRVRELPGVHEVGFFHHAGQIAPPLWSASGRLGVLLMTATSDAELDARTADALAALNVIIEPMEPSAAATAWAEQVAREREGRA